MFPEQNQEDPKSLLADLRQYHKVLVHNPLSNDFTWQIARSVAEANPRYIDPIMKQLNMRNDAHPTMGHVYSKVTVQAGSSMFLPGDVAQVLVKHLVDELMYRAGHKQTVGDPVLRRQFEEEVILNMSDLRSTLSTASMEDQLAQQIAEMNKEPDFGEVANDNAGEQAFPDIAGNDTPAVTGATTAAGSGNRRGRKPAAQPAA